MKKTSLLLAIGALLYGTSGSYVLAEDVDFSAMSPEEINAFLDTIDFPAAEEGIPEDAPDSGGDPIDGLDPAQALPKNVYIAATPSPTPTPLVPGDKSEEVIGTSMCNPPNFSFPVNGAEMEGILVEVKFANGTTDSDQWEATSVNGGEALGFVAGKGWILAEKGDTWNNQWVLYTNKAITQIAIKALDVYPAKIVDGKKKVYTFDVGGKQRDGTFDEHTYGAARGRAFALKLSNPAFDKATYSDPVYISGPPAGPAGTVHPPVLPKDGNAAVAPHGVPTHDLYGTLVIDFKDGGIVGAAEMEVPVLGFIADTDCILPVTGAVYSANQLTLYGEGLVYVSANGSPLQGFPAFEVMKDGVNTFDVSDVIAKLKAGSCYSLVNESSLGTNIPLEIDGVDMPNGEACL